MAAALVSLGAVSAEQGDAAAGQAQLDEAREILASVGSPYVEALLEINQARVHLVTGNGAEVQAALARAQVLALHSGLGPRAPLRQELERVRGLTAQR